MCDEGAARGAAVHQKASEEVLRGASTLVSLKYEPLPEEDAAEVEEDVAPPNDLLCPITHALMREPMRAADGCVYDRHAIKRWFSQRLSSPLTGEALTSAELEPIDELRERATAWATANRHTTEGAAYFGCRYCGEARCPQPDACRHIFEAKTRQDRAYGAAVRRRAWLEGNVLPPAERALQAGPAGAGALMMGAGLVGAVGVLLGGVASSLCEVTGGGIEVVAGLGSQLVDAGSAALYGSDAGAPPAADGVVTPRVDPSLADAGDDAVVSIWRRTRLRGQLVDDGSPTPFDRYHGIDPLRPSATRGCARMASAVTVLPVATVAATATCVVGVAVGAVTMTCGVAKEIVYGAAEAGYAAGLYIAGGEQLSGAAPAPPTLLGEADGLAALALLPPTLQDELIADALAADS